MPTEKSHFSGPVAAILSAALFGLSPVFCKQLLGDMSPALLAGLLYLGSGLGLTGVIVYQRAGFLRELTRLTPLHRRKLLWAVLAGGVIAPLCLTYGIKYGTAAEVTLLLNLETVATTFIAWLIFKEQVSKQVWIGKVLIILAAILVLLRPDGDLAFSRSGGLVLLACIFWGIDNNLTRDVDELPATILAAVKGYGAGLFTILLALLFTPAPTTPGQIGGALLIGALSYGLSLVLFVEALRRIGSARTSTFFAVGPFIGTTFAVLILGERLPLPFLLAAGLMLAGVAILYGEQHGHLHTHPATAHRHRHNHDDHHQHEHAAGDDLAADHYHEHESLTHLHAHWPDTQHRHTH
jgi:drug/metabolite transporter (DMT)-like permease